MSTDRRDERSLRSKAENLIRSRCPTGTAVDTDFLLHELQVHQIELELQNEELRETQVDLEKHRARYMELYHNAPVGYIVLNFSGIITEANATFARMVGAEKEGLHGKAFATFLPKEEQAIFRSRLRSFFKNPIDKHIAVRILAGGANEPHFVDLAAAVCKPGEGLSPRLEDELLVTVTDVTDRAKYEQALAKSHNFTLAILNSLESHVCVLDNQGTVIAVNEAWRRFSAENPLVSAPVAEGINYLEVCDRTEGEDAGGARAFAAGIRAVLNGEVPIFAMEYSCHGNGQQRWFTGKVTRLAEDGEVNQVVVAHENITPRILLEQEQLRLQAQINQLAKSESLSRMAGAISHNFNNILAAILGNLELAADMMPQTEKGRPGMFIDEALKATWKAMEISRLMLTYLGKVPTRKEALDFSTVGTKVVGDLLRTKPKNISLSTDFISPGPVVWANAQQLEQIISNLVANAWEAMSERGGGIKLTIDACAARAIPHACRFPLRYQAEEGIDYARLTVSDEGCGIATDDLDKIFDPFFSSKFTGRGMGLAVVLGILSVHQGVVTVDSRPGHGSTFQVFLPLQITPHDPAKKHHR